MLKKTITYEDFNGETVSEDFFFHISKADLVELEVSHQGGLSTWLANIIKSNDGASIIAEFKKLVLMAYGQKSDDGKRFIRNEKMKEEFLSSEAYSTLFMELVTDAEAATEFINGIVPKGLDTQLEAIQPPKTEIPVVEDDSQYGVRMISKAEAVAMDADELKHLIATGAIIRG